MSPWHHPMGVEHAGSTPFAFQSAASKLRLTWSWSSCSLPFPRDQTLSLMIPLSRVSLCDN
eukprot:6370629-Amphidinium_carterae.1